MKQHGVSLLMALLVMAAAAHKVEVKERPVDSAEDAELDEWDASKEEELWGPQEERHLGINVLDRKGNIIVSDPTERVLRALVKPEKHSHRALTLEKVKALYQKLEEAEHKKEIGSSSKNHIEEMLAREQKAYEHPQERQSEDDSLVKRVLKLLW